MVLRASSLGGLLVLLLGLAILETPASAQGAQTRASTKQVVVQVDKVRLNSNTVGIMSGKSDSAHLAAVEDMASVLDSGTDLRIIAMIGKGALQNVQDVLSLQNTDMGVTHANVLSYLQKTNLLGPDIRDRLRFVTKLYNEEVHIVAKSNVTDLRGLKGQRVNTGEPGSGTALTAQLIFEALGIDIVPVGMVQSDALVAIQNGEIAATVLVAGKPSPLFDIFRLKGDLKLLPIPYEEALEAEYLPTQFTHDDYPTLVPEGETIETVAVPAVLAVFNWRKGTDRYRRVATFTEAFFSKFDEFRKPPRHPKWREVTLNADVPGWTRFAAAQEWLDRNAAQVSKAAPAAPAAANIPAQRRSFVEFLSAQPGGASANAADKEALFRQFLDFMNRQGGGAGAGTAAAPTKPGATPAAGGAAPAPGQRLW